MRLQKDNEVGDVGVNFFEALSVSWVMAVFKAAYALLAVAWGVHLFHLYYDAPFDISNLLDANQKIIIFSILLKVVLFPLHLWIYYKVWLYSIKFFASIADLKEYSEEVGSQVISNALTAHTFLLIPVFGDAIFHGAFMIYLYAGLRRNLGLSIVQSLVVLIIPLFLIFLVFVALLVGIIFSLSSILHGL